MHHFCPSYFIFEKPRKGAREGERGRERHRVMESGGGERDGEMGRWRERQGKRARHREMRRDGERQRKREMEGEKGGCWEISSVLKQAQI